MKGMIFLVFSTMIALAGLNDSHVSVAAKGPVTKTADQRELRRGLPPFVAATAFEGIIYLAYASPNQILRLDMETQSFLPGFLLDAAPTAMAVGADGIYLACGPEIKRLSLDGLVTTPLYTASETVYDMLLHPEFLFLSAGLSIKTLDRDSGQALFTLDHSSVDGNFSLDLDHSLLYGRSILSSPSSLEQFSIAVTGELTYERGSSHYTVVGGSKTFVLPGVGVTDMSGVVFTNELEYIYAFAGTYDDLVLSGQNPILLRNNVLYRYDTQFRETDRLVLESPALRIFIDGTDVFALHQNGGSLTLTRHALGDFAPAIPVLPVDPEGLAYLPSEIVHDGQGTFYLLSPQYPQVFRWNQESGYLSSIALAERPLKLAYSADRKLYLGYASGRITQIDLSGPQPSPETTHVNLAAGLNSLKQAGAYLFASDDLSHYSFDADGAMLDQVFGDYSPEYIWSEKHQRMYFFSYSSSPRDLYWQHLDDMGQFDAILESPYHGDYAFEVPLRLIQNESAVLIGAGTLFGADDLVFQGQLPGPVDDAFWAFNALFTVRTNFDNTVTLVRRNAALDETDHWIYAGEQARIFPSGTDGVLILLVDGVPQFHLFDQGFCAFSWESWPSRSILDMTLCLGN